MRSSKRHLARGVEIDSRDEDGMTPLMKAAMRNRNPEVIMPLLRAGADPSLR
ncbi:MAG TPA: ankyrin repeat domain-containing protein [Bacillota bacterium]|nr:ankyrin repeat domain-containing protein [Bacillota bacterium]HOI38019.1 ankyrin repeat domain-containing protein [Bacillota bacterium]